MQPLTRGCENNFMNVPLNTFSHEAWRSLTHKKNSQERVTSSCTTVVFFVNVAKWIEIARRTQIQILMIEKRFFSADI